MPTGAKADDVDRVAPQHPLHEKRCDETIQKNIENLATANF
jgi:hypothetical protein